MSLNQQLDDPLLNNCVLDSIYLYNTNRLTPESKNSDVMNTTQDPTTLLQFKSYNEDIDLNSNKVKVNEMPKLKKLHHPQDEVIKTKLMNSKEDSQDVKSMVNVRVNYNKHPKLSTKLTQRFYLDQKNEGVQEQEAMPTKETNYVEGNEAGLEHNIDLSRAEVTAASMDQMGNIEIDATNIIDTPYQNVGTNLRREVYQPDGSAVEAKEIQPVPDINWYHEWSIKQRDYMKLQEQQEETDYTIQLLEQTCQKQISDINSRDERIAELEHQLQLFHAYYSKTLTSLQQENLTLKNNWQLQASNNNVIMKNMNTAVSGNFQQETDNTRISEMTYSYKVSEIYAPTQLGNTTTEHRLNEGSNKRKLDTEYTEYNSSELKKGRSDLKVEPHCESETSYISKIPKENLKKAYDLENYCESYDTENDMKPFDNLSPKSSITSANDAEKIVEIIPGSGVSIRNGVLTDCVFKARNSASMLMRFLLEQFFQLETLASSSAAGRGHAKRPPLNTTITTNIIKFIKTKFPDIKESALLQAINQKCTDARKTLRKQAAKESEVK